MSYLLAIAALAVLIIVHEAGHMWIARVCGMRVVKFSIFFGPPIFRWERGDTTYQLGVVPLGGYVQIAGMNPHDELPETDEGSYQNKPAWQRFVTILAGPGVNYAFAIVIMIAVTFIWGLPRWQIAVGEVVDKSPAAMAGFRAGDTIISVEGVAVTSVETVTTTVLGSGGRPLTFGLKRDGQRITVRVAPKQDKGAWRIGIGFGQHLGFVPISLLKALGASLYYPVGLSGKVVHMLGQLITRKISTKQVGGPVEILHQLKTSFESGAATALLFMAMLNIYLGLFNLLPLPALDGGRLAFLGVEIITRRRVSQRLENAVHTIGFLLLIGLLLLVTYGDITRRFGK